MSDPTYPILEPGHVVTIADDGAQVVECPFEPQDDGTAELRDAPTPDSFRTSWSPNAAPEEVNCLFCEVLANGELVWVDHGCMDSGDRDEDGVQ